MGRRPFPLGARTHLPELGLTLGWVLAAALPSCAQAPAQPTSGSAAQKTFAPLPPPSPATPPGGRFATTIHRPYAQLGIVSDKVDARGKPARTPCLTCHANVKAKDANRGKKRLTDFHQEVRIVHGGQTCRSCHQVPGFEGFHLADGTPIAYENVMQLCAQCHASRYWEYQNGAHGGMNGYWDLTRGPRTRNQCIDCHNAHAPRVPKVVPAPRQRYRKGL